MAEVVQRCSARSVLAGRPAGMTKTLEDLHATLLRAGARTAGLSNFRVPPAGAGQHNATPPPALDHLSKQSRRHSRPRAGSKGCSDDPPADDGKSRAAAHNIAAANASSSSVWVWGQDTKKASVNATGQQQHQQQHQQQEEQQQQVTHGVTADDTGDDGTTKAPVSVAERKKMFADVKSSSSCSTVDLTASESGSNKANSPTCVAALDDSFWNQLSEFSVRFPEPPTRVPTPVPSNSTALAISGWGKNITSTLPSVQVLLPPRWRKRLRAAGSHKRCRKANSRWIARSKATSSMSERCVFARAVSISDGTSFHHRQRREKEVGVAPVAVSHDSGPAAVSHELAPTVIEAVVEEKPSEFEVVAEVSEKSAPELVGLAEDKEEEPPTSPTQQQRQQQEEQQQVQQRQLELQQELKLQQQELERQLQQLEQQQQQLEQQQRQLEQQRRLQQQQQQQREQQNHHQRLQQHDRRAVPSELPTPVAVQAPLLTPPPAPLWTAPRPPLSRQQTPLPARYPLRRTARHFGSVSSQGTARESNHRSPAPSPYMTTSRMMMKNRLASSGSSIFEEDGDDSKKTKWLNPFTLSPAAPGLAPVRATTAAASAAAPAAVPPAAPAATACNPYARGACDTPRAPNTDKGTGACPAPSQSSPTWVWGGRGPRTSSAYAVANQEQQQQPKPQPQPQPQPQPSMFETGAGWGRKRRDAAVRALAAEINRRDAKIYGDQRRRMRNGESGIWLPSPGIWSSGRRPTPLGSDVFHAW